VIEGEIPPGQRDLCDPFGEVAGLYQAQCLRPIFNVKAITFRRGAIMQDIFSGYRDGFVGFHSIIKEGALDELLRPRFPNLREIHLPDSGSGMRAAYISVRNARPDQVQEIARAAIDGVMVQMVVVVDDDINVFDETEVLWAMHTYADPSEGITMHGGQADRRHGAPSWIPRSGFGTSNWEGQKMIVDATKPTNYSFGSRSTIPGDVLERINLADYAPSEARPIVR
jgi:2,5-furandicarboxylate decarboxylase 1